MQAPATSSPNHLALVPDEVQIAEVTAETSVAPELAGAAKFAIVALAVCLAFFIVIAWQPF